MSGVKYNQFTDPRHDTLTKQLAKDIHAYMTGTNNNFPISKKLADSVKEWPVATKEFTLFRGQTTKYSTLPASTKAPFFSTSMGFDVAQRFAEEYEENGQVFMIKIQPGVRFLILSRMAEAEVLVESGGTAEYRPKETYYDSDYDLEGEVVPVIYKPPSSGGRRKTRRRKTRRRYTIR